MHWLFVTTRDWEKIDTKTSPHYLNHSKIIEKKIIEKLEKFKTKYIEIIQLLFDFQIPLQQIKNVPLTMSRQ